MKAKSILALCTIAIMIVAIGCSNGSRTTSPLTENLNIPNGYDVNRIATPDAQSPVITSPGFVVFSGTYFKDHLNCTTLTISKDNVVELQFLTEPNIPLRNGLVIDVRGTLSPTPGSRCGLATLVIVDKVQIHKANTHVSGPINGIS
jgi:hypothetical protein